MSKCYLPLGSADLVGEPPYIFQWTLILTIIASSLQLINISRGPQASVQPGIAIWSLAYFVLLASSIKNGLSGVSDLTVWSNKVVVLLHSPKAREQAEGAVFLTFSTTGPI